MTPKADRPMLGILLMLGFCVLAPMGDALAKVLGEAIAVPLLILVRFGMQALLLIPVALLLGNSLRISQRMFVIIALRTALHITGLWAMFTSLKYLPLADAIAIAFVMPFIMLLLGKLVLNEDVGPHRLAACAVGFVGTLLVIQPNFASVGAPALLPLLVAVVFSLFMLVTRTIAKDIDAISLQAISGAQATVVLLPLLVFGPIAQDFGVLTSDAKTVQLLLLLGVLGTAAHLLMTGSLRFAPSATVAPMQYLEIPFGTIIGYLIWQVLPNGLAALGICITIAAGLYVIARERAIARQTARP